jgi:hypothetical protein
MFSFNSLFIMLSTTTCSIVLKYILLLLPCGQQHPPLLALLATDASAHHFLHITSCVLGGAPQAAYPFARLSHAFHQVHMCCSLQNILPGTSQRLPGGQAGQCSACAGVVCASNRDSSGQSHGQDAEMVPSGSIDLLTSGIYGSCGGRLYQDNNNGAS